MNEKIIWSNVLELITNEVTSLSFETWFKDTELHEIKENKAIILVPMAIHKKHLTDKYIDLIRDTLKNVAGDEYEIEFNGTVYSGTVPAAPIDYNARYMNREEVANILNVDIEELSDENEYGISVVFDENTQKFRIGPIVMDYVEERVHIEGRNPVEFAGITDMTLHTNLGEVPKDKWSIVFLDDFRSDDDEYGYPHEQEPFYIEMDYIEGAIEITDLHTTFRYMNAGGKWEKLEGVYNKITWESAYKANRCS